MLDSSVGQVVNEHQVAEVGFESGVSQGSSVSHILLTIYMSGVFREVEKEVKKFMTISLVDD